MATVSEPGTPKRATESTKQRPTVAPSSPRPRRIKKQQLSSDSCFKIILGLALVQALCLLYLGFCSDELDLDEWSHGPLDLFRPLSLVDTTDDHNDDLVEMEDLLADKVEDKLKQPPIEKGEINDDAIDDYYSRPHISNQVKVPLIVGGSDGSGTRAFVDVLNKLGVPMLIDDAHTMDVHGASMFGGMGWPPLATAVLREMHSANYEFSSLSETTQNATIREISKLESKNQLRYDRLQHRMYKSGAIHEVATGVSYGFKAPVSMLLVPIFSQKHSVMKYIHVVRDGRDVALSSNQSPVKKFYNEMYPDGETRANNSTGGEMNIKAMQLWNDWNTQLLEWERANADGKTFDFLVMRTEDLLDPERKFESLLQLADFVGSRRTLEELCCMSRKAVSDMGQSAGRGDGGFSKERLAAFRKKMGLNSESFSLMSREERINYMREMRDRAGERKEGLRSKFRLEQEQNADLSLSERAEIRKRKFEKLGRKIAERNGGSRRGFDRIRGGRRGSFVKENEALIGRRRLDDHEEQMKREEIRHDRLSRAIERKSHLGFGSRFGRPLDRRNLDAKGLNITQVPPVHKRYGKWTKFLQERPDLSRELHKDGAKGLSSFGYEPQRRFMDFDKSNRNFQCDETVVCPEPDESGGD